MRDLIEVERELAEARVNEAVALRKAEEAEDRCWVWQDWAVRVYAVARAEIDTLEAALAARQDSELARKVSALRAQLLRHECM